MARRIGMLDAVIDAVKEVAKHEIIPRYLKVQGHYKSDGSLCTGADIAAQEALIGKLQEIYPGKIVSEEMSVAQNNDQWSSGDGGLWCIDPIDGTRSFIQGLPLFASLMCLLHKGEPVLGIIELPALKETAWAVKGKGAFLNGKPLNVSKQKKLQGAFIAVSDGYCFREQKQTFLLNKLNKEAGIVRTYPDAFGHLMAIRGSVDVMVDPLAKIWDYAPCKILAQEAGGKFANFSGSQSSIEQGTAIVGNASIVKEVRKLFAESKPK